MTVPPAYFRTAVLEEIPYPVKGAYMQCMNPLLAYADSRQTRDALEKLDFFAVSDVFMTPTASFADIVLPAATQLEFNDIGHYGLGRGCILARPKIVDPPEECWPDMKILNELGKSMTPADHWFEDHEAMLDQVLKTAGLDFAAFAEKGYLKGPDRFHKYRSSGFRTPTGKVELLLSKAESLGLPPLPQYSGPPEAEDPAYPLILTCSKSRFFLHSSYRWLDRLRKHYPKPVVEIHPETACAYGIEDGMEVILESPSGQIVQTSRVTDAILPGVVHAAYGWWFPEAGAESQFDWQGANYNMLTSTRRLGKAFGTPNLKGVNCRISAASRPDSPVKD